MKSPADQSAAGAPDDHLPGTVDHLPGVADDLSGTADHLPGTAPDDDAADPPGTDAAAGTTGPNAAELTERERAILAFEQRWWKHAGAKEQAIRETFDLSATRYYQLLNALLDNPAALATEPVLVGRLRRLRATRSRARRR